MAYRWQVPPWWDAAIRPAGSTGDLFSAKDCAGGANLLLSTDVYEGALSTYVDESLAFYERRPRSSRLRARVTHAARRRRRRRRELLVFTWLPEGYPEPLRQWQMFAMRGTTVAYGTITTYAADEEYYAPDIAVILPSMAMTDP